MVAAYALHHIEQLLHVGVATWLWKGIVYVCGHAQQQHAAGASMRRAQGVGDSRQRSSAGTATTSNVH